MGCCASSPHSKRRYRYATIDDDDEYANDDDEMEYADEIHGSLRIRHFGTNRRGGVTVPDDIGGMPSTHILKDLPTSQDPILYEAEIDQGQAFRCYRPLFAILLTPCGLVYLLTKALTSTTAMAAFTCDEACCWLRKEYSTRTWFRIYSNRIEVNVPLIRIPWGLCGCGSWNADKIKTHPFDRGAFGFRKVHCGVINYLCCTWPLYGGVVARQRCQCNGPLWNRMFTDCGGWWCDEWPCDMMCCTYRYHGLAHADEVAAAANICLQAYFEGRTITKEDVQKCLAYWEEHVSESGGGPKRDVCCEPHCQLPCCTDCKFYHKYICHPRRVLPYKDENEISEEIKEVYKNYNIARRKEIAFYENYQAPVRSSTFCQKCGCRRFWGRHGCCFCTEGCNHFDRKTGDPAPPFDHRDIDDECNASVILRRVLGPPPKNVVYRQWEFKDETSDEIVLVTYDGSNSNSSNVSGGGVNLEAGIKQN